MVYETTSYIVDYQRIPPVYTCKSCPHECNSAESIIAHLRTHKPVTHKQTTMVHDEDCECPDCTDYEVNKLDEEEE